MISKYSIESVFGEPIEIIDGKGGSKEYRYNCPFCVDNRGDPDNKGHLFVNDKYGVYHCYRCGAKGKVNEDKSDYSHEELVDNTELVKLLSQVVDSDNGPPLDMIIPRKKAIDDSAAREYLNKRGFTDDIIDFYDMRVGSVFSKLLGYVVIPNQVKSQIMTDMYCARNFVGKSPKYKNPEDSRSGVIVYNLHRIEDNPDRMIICEGALNAIAAGKDAVSLYGKECSESKLSKILSKKPKQIIINLDLDATNKAYELADKIKKRNSSIDLRICLIDDPECKDAADFLSKGRINEYRDLINNAKIYNPLLEGLFDILGGNK